MKNRQLERALEQLHRFDDKATAILERKLEFVRSKTYDIKYPTLKARKLLPVDNSVDPGAETVSYEQWDEYGMAEIVANYADDIGLVDVLAERFEQPIRSITKGYQYSIQDLRRSSMAGVQLDTKRARACRNAFERRVEQLAATGDAKSKLKGLVNHPNVPVYTAVNDGTSTYWVRGRTLPKAADLIEKDVNDLALNIVSSTKEVHAPNTLLLASHEFGYISTTSVSNDNDTTILRRILANSSWYQGAESWYKLDTADAAGTGPRAVAYERSPEILELVIPAEFEQLPPQAKNLSFVVPAHMRIGGVMIYYPLAVAYLDGLGLVS